MAFHKPRRLGSKQFIYFSYFDIMAHKRCSQIFLEYSIYILIFYEEYQWFSLIVVFHIRREIISTAKKMLRFEYCMNELLWKSSSETSRILLLHNNIIEKKPHVASHCHTQRGNKLHGFRLIDRKCRTFSTLHWSHR